MKKLLSLMLSLLMLCAPFVASAEEVPVLRVGILASYYSAAIYYADAMGYDTEAGIDLQPVEFASGAPMNDCFAAGTLELADMGPAAVYAVGKFGAKCIAQNARQIAVQLIVPADSPVLSAQDENGVYGSAELLRNLTVMGPSGTYAHYLIIGYLSRFGLTMEDIHYVDMSYSEALAAFEQGQCDICCMQNPNVFDAIQAGYVSLGDPAVIAPMYENLVCSGDAYTNNADAVATALTVIYRAQEELMADDALAAGWLGEYYAKVGYTASEEAVLDEVQNQRPLLSLAEAAAISVGESLVDTALFMQSVGLIEESVTEAVRDNVVSDILKKACALSGIDCQQ